MAEDIDNLLDDIEADFRKASKKKLQEDTMKDRSLSNDVKDLLDMTITDDDAGIGSQFVPRKNSNSKSSATKRKCTEILLGGSNTSTGLSTSLSPK